MNVGKLAKQEKEKFSRCSYKIEPIFNLIHLRLKLTILAEVGS